MGEDEKEKTFQKMKGLVIFLIFFFFFISAHSEPERAYRPELFSADVAKESARLLAQLRQFGEVERELYERHLGGMRAPRVLLLGCGPGHVASRVIFPRWPSANVTCVEVERRFIEEGTRGPLRSYIKNAQFRYIHGDVRMLRRLVPCHVERYDAVVARLLLQHVEERVRLLILRHAEQHCLRVGAPLLALSVDAALSDIVEPSTPALDYLEEEAVRRRPLRAGRSGEAAPDDYCGRDLPYLARRAGFERVRVQVLTSSSESHGFGVIAQLLDVSQYQWLVDAGHVEPEDLQSAREELREMLQWNALNGDDPRLRPLYMSFLVVTSAVNLSPALLPGTKWDKTRIQRFWAEAGRAGGASSEATTFHIVVWGDLDDYDLQLDGEMLALRQLGFPAPVVHWPASERAVRQIPRGAPIILVSHTTDDTYVNDPEHSFDPTDIRAGVFRPTPPVNGHYKPGDMFFWGWPEPFPFASNEPWVPPRTALEGLYPFRDQPLVVLASCYGKRLEGVFRNTKGLSADEYLVPLEDTYEMLPAPALVEVLWEYGEKAGLVMRNTDWREFYSRVSVEEADLHRLEQLGDVKRES